MKLKKLMEEYPVFREYCEENEEEEFTKEDFDNPSWFIRLEAYRELGFTEKALEDDNWFIRQEACEYFYE